MSQLRIGLVAEGVTDHIVIEAALSAILPEPFVLQLLQPEATRPELGTGWCGVLKWCLEFRSRGLAGLEDDPTLELFDFIVLHLDADVAGGAYDQCGPEIDAQATGLGLLPCAKPCPPPGDTVHALETVLLTWLGVVGSGPRTLLCFPSKSIESWVAAALFPSSHALLADIECTPALDAKLAQLPLAQRIRKRRTDYIKHANKISEAWADVCVRCEQARQFHAAVQAVAGT